MSELETFLNQVAARYRRALLMRAGLLAGLSLGALGVLAWRLRTMGVSAVWSVGVPVVVGLGGIAGLGWWARARWVSRQGAAAHLDRTLDLQQRLITAAEYSRMASPPALYAALAQEVAQHCSSRHPRFPKPFDHAMGMLLAALLLFLFWPHQQLVRQAAVQPPGEQPTAPTPLKTPPESQPDAAAQPQQRRADSQPSSASQQSSGSQQATPSSGQNSASQESSAQASSPQGPSSTEHAQAAADRQSSKSHHAKGSRKDQRSGASPGSTQGTGSERNASTAASQQIAAQAQSSNQGTSGTSAGNQEAMKGEIQRLLKEVSGELQELQTQLASAQRQPDPKAGTSTDPELYESPMPDDLNAGAQSLPITLPTDTATTKTPRPSAGVGRPAAEASSATPQMTAEQAALTDRPADESPSARQPIPPEYRGVFDRLQHDSPPSEQTP